MTRTRRQMLAAGLICLVLLGWIVVLASFRSFSGRADGEGSFDDPEYYPVDMQTILQYSETAPHWMAVQRFTLPRETVAAIIHDHPTLAYENLDSRSGEYPPDVPVTENLVISEVVYSAREDAGWIPDGSRDGEAVFQRTAVLSPEHSSGDVFKQTVALGIGPDVDLYLRTPDFVPATSRFILETSGRSTISLAAPRGAVLATRPPARAGTGAITGASSIEVQILSGWARAQPLRTLAGLTTTGWAAISMAAVIVICAWLLGAGPESAKGSIG